ncbi:type I polyketide synthase [Tomitella fengzijianii]|uniref:type I polyketide synthase n=1 Tax=Tomitella fengzijianii TaxID=2597660 RepID=UPI001E5B6831
MTIEAFGSGRDDDSTGADAATDGAAATRSGGTPLADRLRGGEKYAVAFGGQGAPWLDPLTELATDAQLEGELTALVDESERILAPVRSELLVVRPSGFDPIGWGIEATRPRQSALTSAAISLPGVLLTQLAAVRSLAENGLDLRTEETGAHNVATLGHSQGVLAADALAAGGRDDARLLALAQLIGAAATLVSRRRGLIGTTDRSPMLAVSGVEPERIEAALAEVFGARTLDRPVLAIRNGRRRIVLTGDPDHLARLRMHCEGIAAQEKDERADKVTGGAPFAPVFEHVAVEAGFHHPELREAVQMVADWAERCGLDVEQASRLTDSILVAPVDWVGSVDAAVDAGASWILDLGPGDLLTRMTAGVVRGTGVGVVPASTRAGQRNLFTPGAAPEVENAWSQFAPTAKKLPDGRVVVETAFTRLTGRSPILLAGMTPTTVDARIVAAAANAGHWAELAGGGQVTEEIFLNRIDELNALLEPGRAVQFNSLFLDPYLWKLQVGGKRLVQKARTTGAALDGLIVTAGIPELEDALALIEERAEIGIPYIAFKPGTVAQIRSVVRIAAEVPDYPIIVQVEGGKAGGHHSWEELDDLLLTTYGELRARANVVVCVGGGIGTPERAADYLTGRWSTQHGFPAMPVDGILVGTAAMATLEATTAPEVKRMLVETPGTPGWIGAGSAEGGMASGRSQLGADIHEIDNAASRCGRLLDDVAGDVDAVAERRDEIVAAMAGTAKPYFGDVTAMPYEQWLRRYVELTMGHDLADDGSVWADVTWRDRFGEMLRRAEARLNPVEHGPIPTLFGDAPAVLDTPEAAVDALVAQYPAATSTLLHPADVSFFVELCRTPGKPVNFVPVIDKDVRRWWRSDSLWQAHDARYGADEVCIIPGPVSVAGITRADEPVGELLDRFEKATADELLAGDGAAATIPARRHLGVGDAVADAVDLVLASPDIRWAGRHTINPVHRLGAPSEWRLSGDGAEHPLTGATLAVVEEGAALLLTVPLVGEQAVRIRITVPASTVDGGTPLVGADDAEAAMSELLGVAAGQQLPEVKGGVARINLAWTPDLIADHGGVTSAGLPDDFAPGAAGVPDVLVGACWPAVFAAIGAARVPGSDSASVIEGMLDLVHLDHAIGLAGALPGEPSILTVRAEAAEVSDSDLGRVVEVKVAVGSVRDLGLESTPVAELTERFAIRGRAGRGELADPQRAGGKAGDVHESPRRRRRQATVQAPIAMDAFAQVSGDHNPIHVSDSAAKLAGLGAPIVHGMWLSAAAQQVATATLYEGTEKQAGWTPTPLAGWTARFLAPVRPGAEIDVRVERVGLDAGREVIEVSCRVEGELVMIASGVLEAPRTVYAFPGQGIQHKGMGLDARASSPAAKKVWERADKHTRAALGFSILAVVRDNPTALTAKGETYQHPDGVLFLTQFTQVAMATLACAQVAELREAGAFVEGSLFAGHSVGEYNALAAVAQVLPLEAVLEVVFHRGSAMHHLVPRDAEGRSDYRLGAIRPSQAGIADDDVTDYVERIAAESGEFLQVVNYNLRGSQYAIAGTVAGLDALSDDIDARRLARGGKKAFILVPGIDVPFHSRVLLGGVPEFRQTLEKLVPHDIDPSILVGRYVPNLVPRAFTLDRAFVQEIRDLVPAESLDAVLGDYDSWAANPSALTRILLIELLAWQFASPVRWIETQDLLFSEAETGGLDVERFVEVGVGRMPTVANLASQTLKLPGQVGAGPQVLNSERERAILLCTDTEPEPVEEATEAAEPADASAAAAPAPEAAPASAPAAPAGGPRPDDIPFTAGDATRTLIALWTKLRADQMTGSDTIESLTDGASSRRNQLLVDLGAELNLGAIDGAAEAAMPQLQSTVVGMARTYKPFGPVLTDAVGDQLRRVFGPSGKRPAHIGDRVRGEWELGDGWVSHVTAMLALGTRDGSSVRGGDLGGLTDGPVTDGGAADALIDAAVLAVGEARGVAVSKPAAAAGGGVVDSAALGEFAEKVTGPAGVLAETARTILAQLGIAEPGADALADAEQAEAELADLISNELGSDWARQVAPAFDARKAVLLDDRWASAREDLARMWLASAEEIGELADGFATVDESVAAHADWWRRRAEREGRDSLAAEYAAIAAAPRTAARSGEFAGDTAVVTGAGKGSIAGAVVGELLAGGATVIATTSSLTQKKLAYFRELYRTSAREGAALWVLPVNMASFSDVDALIDWIGTEQTESAGGKATVIKDPMTPTMLFPFAAPRVVGDLRDAGAKSELQMRVLLWAVERLVAGLSGIGADHDIASRLHVVLPGSPNRGKFGGDGAYGESKASLDALVNRWHAERGWGERVTLVHAIIGWVRGTGLMGGNDPLVEQVEAKGVRTWAPDEIAVELLGAASQEARGQAAEAPQTLDLTGGLGEADLDLAELAGTQGDAEDEGDPGAEAFAASVQATIDALPCPPELRLTATAPSWPEVTAAPEDLVVIVGAGELGPYGSARTRFEMEVDEQLSPAGVLELAWSTGMVTWETTPKAGWYDAESGDQVPEAEIWERYHDAVVERCGIRLFDDEGAMVDQTSPLLTSVFLDKDLTFTVSSESEARAFVDADPERTTMASVPETGDWKVTRKAGTEIRVPRRVNLTRTVGGQIPTGFDPTVWGIPADMAGAIDRVAQWNLVCTVDAFLSAGFSPAELLRWVHPTQVANTQGTGMGGMTSMRALYVDNLLGEPHANDTLQEALPNVIAAHVVQSYVGGYGAMVHPVAACATAAVSVEEGVDKIRLGKADFAVAGGFDDLSIEGIVGFGDMSATADSEAMAAKGIDPRRFSRANDRRRGGFVESAGGGTVLLARGDVAAELGLPVLGVVAWAGSHADGVHTSIPAPGIGALGVARGGRTSQLAKALATVGLTVDDVAVVSKHDTSTAANDPNESELHERIADALGRDPGNPLFVVSQKTLTGHSKGGAAAFQLIGLCQVLGTGIVPPNRSLDCVDGAFTEYPRLVWTREEPLRFGNEMPLRAGLLTSLGFGHVAGLIAVAHPEAFVASLPEGARDAYRAKAAERQVAGARRLTQAMVGGAELYERPEGRRFDGLGCSATGKVSIKEHEAAMLLEPQSRLNRDGEYRLRGEE